MTLRWVKIPIQRNGKRSEKKKIRLNGFVDYIKGSIHLSNLNYQPLKIKKKPSRTNRYDICIRQTTILL